MAGSTLRTPQEQNRLLNKLLGAAMLFAVLAIVVISRLVSASDAAFNTARPSDPVVAITHNITVSGRMACAASKLDEIMFIHVARAHDEEGMNGLIVRGNVDILEPGTIADVLWTDDSGLDNIMVRSGYAVGKTCWIPAQSLNR